MQELWNLMETPMDERSRFDHVSSLLLVPADDVMKKGCLGLDIIREVMQSYLQISFIYSDISESASI